MKRLHSNAKHAYSTGKTRHSLPGGRMTLCSIIPLACRVLDHEMKASARVFCYNCPEDTISCPLYPGVNHAL